MSSGGLAPVTVALARRALRNALRRPQLLLPLVAVPTLMLAVNTGGLTHATRLDGFPPVADFFDFQLAAVTTQALMFGGVSMGVAAALEIEAGFFARLAVAPIPRLAIVLGRLLAGAVIALTQVVYFLVLGLVFGATIQGGLPGALLTVLIGTLAGVGFAGVGLVLALRARSASTVQGIFPIAFVFVFVSSAMFPMELLSAPVDDIARFNPLSYIADGMRAPVIDSVRAEPVLEGLAAAGGLAVAMAAMAVAALRGRLRDA